MTEGMISILPLGRDKVFPHLGDRLSWLVLPQSRFLPKMRKTLRLYITSPGKNN